MWYDAYEMIRPASGENRKERYMEIERKFTVKRMPDNWTQYPKTRIERA